MKFDTSKIMKAAWEMKKENRNNDFGLCLRYAWAAAKVRAEYIDRLTTIYNASAVAPTYALELNISDWNKNGKSRTYLSIVETRTGSRHYAKKDYGYIDNLTGKYVAASKYANLDGQLFTFGGAKIA